MRLFLFVVLRTSNIHDIGSFRSQEKEKHFSFHIMHCENQTIFFIVQTFEHLNQHLYHNNFLGTFSIRPISNFLPYTLCVSYLVFKFGISSPAKFSHFFSNLLIYFQGLPVLTSLLYSMRNPRPNLHGVKPMTSYRPLHQMEVVAASPQDPLLTTEAPV